jgi:hypothetical protein
VVDAHAERRPEVLVGVDVTRPEVEADVVVAVVRVLGDLDILVVLDRVVRVGLDLLLPLDLVVAERRGWVCLKPPI